MSQHDSLRKRSDQHKTSSSPNKPIGAVFTPYKWALWAVNLLNLADALEQRKTVFDPTGGEGVFVFALIDSWINKYNGNVYEIVDFIYYNEIQKGFIDEFQAKFKEKYGFRFPERNISSDDIIVNNNKKKFDYIIGNPPWINFNDIDSLEYKEELKQFYVKYGLVRNLKEVLLGGSRIDLAALVLFSVFANNVKESTKCAYYLPLSLFLNDGAGETFRNYSIGQIAFSLDYIYDFDGIDVFDGISTRFCFASFSMGGKSKYPISYYMLNDKEEWKEYFAAPITKPNSALIVKKSSSLSEFELKLVEIESWQTPRQGINTCGANDVFIFDELPPSLNEKYLYPLVTTKLLKGTIDAPEKYILLPYHKNGKPLSFAELESEGLSDYFNKHKSKLQNRKGVLINSQIKKDIWWGLIGLGPYSFCKYKIIWSSFGSKEFSPIVLSKYENQEWQANQAMQAFIPSNDLTDAYRIQLQLNTFGIEQHLKDQKMEGTMNWAQPGRIKKFLIEVDKIPSLF